VLPWVLRLLAPPTVAIFAAAAVVCTMGITLLFSARRRSR
jgi:hypothetical protein